MNIRNKEPFESRVIFTLESRCVFAPTPLTIYGIILYFEVYDSCYSYIWYICIRVAEPRKSISYAWNVDGYVRYHTAATGSCRLPIQQESKASDDGTIIFYINGAALCTSFPEELQHAIPALTCSRFMLLTAAVSRLPSHAKPSNEYVFIRVRTA